VDKVLTLLIAVGLDLIFGEPPEIIHPTVWFGKIVEIFDRSYERRSCLADVLFGFFLTLLLIIIAVGITFVFELFHLGFYLLFTSISIRSMVEHAIRTVENGRILRDRVGMIVSRDVSKLGEVELTSAVIESVAENFVDGVFAPLFYYTLFGVYGAMVYRAINTCDAMVGYRKREYECFGKICAKTDDILNYIPARLSVLLFLILNPKAFEVVRKYKGIKLNGGYPISAMAGVLGVNLMKPGYYYVRAGRDPEVGDIYRAVRIYVTLSSMAIILYTLMNLPVESITYLPNLGFTSGIALCSTPIR